VDKEAKAEMIVKRLECMKGERGTWESHWQDVADFMMPHKNSITLTQNPGRKRNDDIFDTTAIRANEKLAAGLFGYLCPPNEQWFLLRSKNPKLLTDETVAMYYSDVSRIILESMYLSNFALEIHEDFLDMGAFGTSCLYIEEGSKTPFRFESIPIANYYISESHQGIIDTVYREFKLTARQAAQKFGEENLSDEIRDILKNEELNKKDKKFTFIHAVQPRTDVKYGIVSNDNKPVMSCYIEKASKHIVKESGYDEMPYLCSRFMKAPTETYGRSPAIDTLPEIKMINAMRKNVIRASEKQVDPPILLPDDGVIGNFNMSAGKLNYLRSSYYENKPVPFETKGNLPIGLEMIQQEMETINGAFYVDLFDMLADRRNMTATEVIERVEEKLIMFAPMLARIQSEKLSPLIERGYGILARRNMLPPPPSILRENPEYEIQYVGKMALALKALDVSATQKTLMGLLEYVQVDPSIMENFDFNKITRGMAMRNGVPAEFMRTQEELDAMHEEQKKMQEQQMMMDQLSQGADVASKLNKKVEAGSPLEALAGQQG
jgi:hypothetical protein